MKDYILSKLDEYKAVFTERPKIIPADAVVDAPITGNGDIGIAVNAVDTTEGRGRPGSTGGGDLKPIPVDHAVEVYFSKNDFWKSGYGCDHHDGGMRGIGKLLAVFEDMGGCDYYAEQHIKDGIITVKLTKGNHGVQCSIYALRGRNLMVVKVKNFGEVPIKGRMDMAVTRAVDAEYHEDYSGGITRIEKSYSGPDLEWPMAAVAMAKVMDKSGRGFTLAANEEAVIIASLVTTHDDEHYRETARLLLDRCTKNSLADALVKHRAWWRDFWLTSGVKLPQEPLVEKLWYGSHYIMAACSGGNKQFPPGQLASWITTDAPCWLGDYHFNYNHEAPFWGLYSSNKIELTEGWEAPIMDYLPAAREAAMRKTGCRGILCIVGIGPKGYISTLLFGKDDGSDDICYWGQKSNASYAAVNMLMRFYATYDLEYARGIAYPYLKETGAFWEDYLVFKDGRYFDYNDSVHENSSLAKRVGWTWGDNWPDYSDDCNSILSLGLIRMVFKGLLDLSHELGDDNPRADKWRHILDHISPFPVQERNGKTVFRYTETGMDWCDSNSLGIQHIFPASAIGLGSDKKLLEISRNTLVELNRWEDYNAFSTFYAAAVRLGYDPEKILQHLNAEIRKHAYNNMYIYHGGGGIEDCSGVPVCVNEMLLQSHEGILRFFPVWEKHKDAEFYKLRTYGDFLVSASIKNGTIGDISLYSEKGKKCVFQKPFEPCAVYRVDGIARIPVKTETTGETCSFETTPGAEYVIAREM
jgi:hypothetical protein